MKILEHKCLIKLNSKQLEICIIKLKDQKSLKIEKKRKITSLCTVIFTVQLSNNFCFYNSF